MSSWRCSINDEMPAPKKEYKTVLIVEDSAVQTLVLKRLLERRGLKVLCAYDGLEGVASAREFLPDLIILDIQMPEMSGLEACNVIKRDPRTHDIPVIILTAHAQPEMLREGLGSGAIDFIPKDAFSEMVLLKTLDQLGVTSATDLEETA